MSIGLKASAGGTSGTIQIGGVDQVTVDNTGQLTATTLTGTTVNGTAMQQGGVAMGRMVLSTAQNSTSGTSIDFTGIPSWVKRITVMFNGVSTNGTSLVQVQIGSGSVSTSGYTTNAGYATNGAATSVSSSTSGFILTGSSSATTVFYGVATLVLFASNTWVYSFSGTQGSLTFLGGGGVGPSLSGTLDRVRLTTVNGTDTFDAGSINILYEG